MESDKKVHDASAPTSTTDNPKMDSVHWPVELQQPHPNPQFHPNDEVSVRLCQIVAKGKWGEVLKICHENWHLVFAPIPGLGGTVLHVAAFNKLEDIFGLLLQQLGPPGSFFANFCLTRENIKGNTPLHNAATVGSKQMCRSIIDREESTTLLSVPNKEGETPLFIAASHGYTDAFLYLHNKVRSPEEERYKYCTRKNGDTILHCAISDEHYVLSLIILREYKQLVNHPNKKGMTPLHLLASKPSAFQSGSNLRWFENIIYHSFVRTDEQELIPRAEQYLERDQVTRGGRQQTFGSRRGATIAVSQVDAEDLERRLTWGGYHSRNGARGHQFHLPSNYETCCFFVKVIFKAMLLILEPLKKVKKVRMMKVRHTWSNLIMTELLKNFSMYQSSTQSSSLSKSENKESEREGTLAADVSEKINTRQLSKICEDKFSKGCQTYINIIQLLCKMAQDEKDKEKEDSEPEDVLLMAAKNGITEMVEKILEIYPMALYNMDKNQKNIVLLTVEHKQPQVYELLLSLKEKNISLFCEVDFEGNSVLHLAATKAEFNWPVPGAASQMQWEIRWYEYIENSMEGSFLPLLNKKGQTPEDVFTKTHEDIVKQGGDWLISTSNACSVVAGLFVTSTFSTATNVPDVVEGNKHNEASKIFASSSFVSFYTSLVAVVMFLSILTSGCRERDFRRALTWKLLLGLTAFYMSIASTLVSFTTGHFFIFRNQLKFVSSTSYIVTYALVTLFSMAVFPLYFHLVWATLKKVPQRIYRMSIPHWLLGD